MLPESIEPPGWTEERAQRWWKRHKPDNLESQGVPCEKIMLTKAPGTGDDDLADVQTPAELLTGAAQ
jgi:hypothetical protein